MRFIPVIGKSQNIIICVTQDSKSYHIQNSLSDVKGLNQYKKKLNYFIQTKY
jgi:hypothetical protein